MSADDPVSLVGLTAQPVDAARSLLMVIDEAIEAQRALEHRIRLSLGLNNTDFRALLTVFRRHRRNLQTHPGDLTRDLGVGSGATAQVVGRLVAAGLLDRADDPSDARAGLLALTPAAVERLVGATGSLRHDLDDLLESLDVDEEARLVELLDQARDIFRAHHDEPV